MTIDPDARDRGKGKRHFRAWPALWLAAAAILAAGLWAPPPALAINCLALWPTPPGEWGAWQDGAGNPVVELPCEEYKPLEVASKFAEFGAEVHVYVYQDAVGTYIAHPYGESTYVGHPNATPGAADLVIEAMYDAMSALKPVHPGVDMTAVLLPTIAGQNEGGSEWRWDAIATARSIEPCPISIYLSTLMNIPADGRPPVPRTPEIVKAVVAHEVYHCYQYKYFPAQMEVDRDDKQWWVEGTATHFEMLVYDCPDPKGAADYVRTSPTYRQGQGYPNVAFFGYLGRMEGFGVAAQSGFLGAMPTENGVALQRRALAAWPGMGAKFHGFARQFVDRTVPCIGAHLQAGEFSTNIIEDQGAIFLEAPSFAIDLSELLLKRNSDYKVRLVPGAGGGPGDANRVSFRQAGADGSWQSLGAGEFTLSTGCTGDPYLFTASNAGADDTPFEVTIEFERIEQEPDMVEIGAFCGPGIDGHRNDCLYCELIRKQPRNNIDPCLAGTWELVSGEREIEADFLRRSSVGAAGVSIKVETKAPRYLFLRPDGVVQYNSSETSLIIIADEAVATRAQKYNPGAGYWTARNGKFEHCAISDDLPETLNVTAPGFFNSSASPSARREHVLSGVSSYNCSAAELRLEKQAIGYRAAWVYRRVEGGAPDECAGR